MRHRRRRAKRRVHDRHRQAPASARQLVDELAAVRVQPRVAAHEVEHRPRPEQPAGGLDMMRDRLALSAEAQLRDGKPGPLGAEELLEADGLEAVRLRDEPRQDRARAALARAAPGVAPRAAPRLLPSAPRLRTQFGSASASRAGAGRASRSQRSGASSTERLLHVLLEGHASQQRGRRGVQASLPERHAGAATPHASENRSVGAGSQLRLAGDRGAQAGRRAVSRSSTVASATRLPATASIHASFTGSAGAPGSARLLEAWNREQDPALAVGQGIEAAGGALHDGVAFRRVSRS